MWTMALWYRLGLTPSLSTRVFWQSPVLSGGPVSRDISGASKIMGEGNENLVYSSPWDFKRSLTCLNILWHGTSRFTSHLKEGVLRIFITFKNPAPWPGSNPRPFGSSGKHTNHYTTKATAILVTVPAFAWRDWGKKGLPVSGPRFEPGTTWIRTTQPRCSVMIVNFHV
jgi:hypothetical protein